MNDFTGSNPTGSDQTHRDFGAVDRPGWSTEHRLAELTHACSAAEARVRELQAERDELRAALEPFAEALLPEHLPDCDSIGIPGATLGDFRRARAALRSPAGPSTDEDKPTIPAFIDPDTGGPLPPLRPSGATDTKDED